MHEKIELERNLEDRNRQVNEMKEIGRKIAEYEGQIGLISQ